MVYDQHVLGLFCNRWQWEKNKKRKIEEYPKLTEGFGALWVGRLADPQRSAGVLSLFSVFQCNQDGFSLL